MQKTLIINTGILNKICNKKLTEEEFYDLFKVCDEQND